MHITRELRKFVAPEIITGDDARLLVGRYISHFGAKKPMIVTDKNLVSMPWFLDILTEINQFIKGSFIYDSVTSNPRAYEVMMGADIFRANDCDILIAIGGGSIIDCAKGIGIVSTNGGDILDYEGVDEINLPGPPLICIPTTSGSSADVSQFAIICDTKHLVKKAIISKKVVPDLALLDPLPLMTMDPYLTACTGMDALTHAIEAYVSNADSHLTNVSAIEAIATINGVIEKAVEPERSLDTMFQMLLGSLQAGLAFSNASLGAVHAMAHSLGGLLDLPHGECNSILLEHVVAVNYDSAVVKYHEIAEKMGIATDELSDEEVKKGLLNRIRTMRIHLGIAEFAIVENLNDEILNTLTEYAMADPCIVTNPKKLTKDEVKAIYERILREK